MKNYEKKITSIINLLKHLIRPDFIPYIGVCIVLTFTFNIHQSGDTQALLIGVNHAVNCLSQTPITFPCGPGVIHFPIFQYLISAPLNVIGFSNSSIIIIIGWMSLAWSIVASAAFWRAGYISAAISGGHFSLLILLSGYLLWYTSSSFNEAASFALFALLVLSILDNWKLIYVCIIAFACTITKEVAFPFVLYFMLVSFFARELRTRQDSSILNCIFNFIYKYKIAILSVIVGFVINLGFNYFRYGSIKNLFNLDPGLHTPLEYIPHFLLFLFISPAAGLFFTWFSLSILLIMPVIFLVRDRSIIFLILFTLIGLILVNIGLASWYSPFGYNAWGPRLSLPFLGSIAILAIYLTANETIIYLKKLGINRGLFVILIIIAISSLPNIAVRLDGDVFFTKMFAKTNIEINSDIQNFTIQSAPISQYMDASIEAYSKNIIIPSTIKNSLTYWPIIFIWLISLFYICRQIILTSNEKNEIINQYTNKSNYHIISINIKIKQRLINISLTKKYAFIFIAILVIIGGALLTKTHRESCSICFDLWHKNRLGEAIAEYQLVAPQENLVNGLDNFPANLPLAKINIKLTESELMEAVSISAIDHQGNDLGNWVTRPINYLWGIGIIDNANPELLKNSGSRKENLKLPIGPELSLLIPDNGNLSKKPKLYIQIYYFGGKRISTIAFYKP